MPLASADTPYSSARSDSNCSTPVDQLAPQRRPGRSRPARCSGREPAVPVDAVADHEPPISRASAAIATGSTSGCTTDSGSSGGRGAMSMRTTSARGGGQAHPPAQQIGPVHAELGGLDHDGGPPGADLQPVHGQALQQRAADPGQASAGRRRGPPGCRPARRCPRACRAPAGRAPPAIIRATTSVASARSALTGPAPA